MNADQKQKLFNYFLQEHKVMLLDGDFNEIENMLTHQIGEEVIKQAYADGFNKGFVVDWETAETKTITSYYEEWKQLHPELFQKQGEWISVKDKLPDKYKEVLAYYPIGGIEILCYSRIGKWFNPSTQESTNEPSHWMPLPSSPNQKGEGE